MDIAFLVIATLSQGAWVFRWSASASWLGGAMVALMMMNAAAMQVGAAPCRGMVPLSLPRSPPSDVWACGVLLARWVRLAQRPGAEGRSTLGCPAHCLWLRLAPPCPQLTVATTARACPQVAVLFPATYVKWREPLCVWSHIAHKLAQTAVTLVPPVGTIFSSSYNPTGASRLAPYTRAGAWCAGRRPRG